jgi:hypothetical protein
MQPKEEAAVCDKPKIRSDCLARTAAALHNVRSA